MSDELLPKRLSIANWSEEDQPREKLMNKGRAALSDAELIAILIGSGTPSESAVEVAKKILHLAKNDLNELAALSLNDLMKIRGIGEAKAISIAAALELGRRRKNTESQKKPIIGSAQHVYDLMYSHLLDLSVEEFWLILLNRANVVIKTVKISEGGVSGTVADPKVIFKAAVEQLASAIIVVHNHPSGNLQPSKADKDLTQKLKEAGKLLDIPLLDHLIFTNNGFFSFADEGIL
jgi:DNA repair protein RadC